MVHQSTDFCYWIQFVVHTNRWYVEQSQPSRLHPALTGSCCCYLTLSFSYCLWLNNHVIYNLLVNGWFMLFSVHQWTNYLQSCVGVHKTVSAAVTVVHAVVCPVVSACSNHFFCWIRSRNTNSECSLEGLSLESLALFVFLLFHYLSPLL